jgi:hypothetical protein
VSWREEYEANRAWSDHFLDEIRDTIAGTKQAWRRHLTVSTEDQDRHEASDLVVLATGDLRIACRVRRPRRDRKFWHDFTIRTMGRKTELQKICDGMGDWYFYAHAKHKGAPHIIVGWSLLDLSVFRAQMGTSGKVKYKRRKNLDGSSFVAFDIRSFPDNFVIACNDAMRPHVSTLQQQQLSI